MFNNENVLVAAPEVLMCYFKNVSTDRQTERQIPTLQYNTVLYITYTVLVNDKLVVIQYKTNKEKIAQTQHAVQSKTLRTTAHPN